MDLYIISMRREDTLAHSAAELTRLIEELPGDVEIVSGRDRSVMTVQMARNTASVAASSIPFAKVENYFEIGLL